MIFQSALSGLRAVPLTLLAIASVGLAGCDKHKQFGEGLPYNYPAAQLMTHNQMAYAKPNGHLKQLDALTGYWTWKQLVWPFPGSDPVSLTGICAGEWILGKRYIKLDYKYVNENADLERGFIFIGHDQMLNTYSLYEIFSTTTAPIISTGQWDEKQNMFSWVMEMPNPLNQKQVKMIRTIHLDESGSLTWTSFRKDLDGKTVPYQQTVLSRVSKAEMEKALRAKDPGAVAPIPSTPNDTPSQGNSPG